MKSVNVFKCLRLGLETINLSQGGNLHILIWGRAGAGVLFYFLMQSFSVTTAVSSEGILSVICIALCLSCKPVVKPEVTNFCW